MPTKSENEKMFIVSFSALFFLHMQTEYWHYIEPFLPTRYNEKNWLFLINNRGPRIVTKDVVIL